jgi:hypothetical protein
MVEKTIYNSQDFMQDDAKTNASPEVMKLNLAASLSIDIVPGQQPGNNLFSPTSNF